MLTTKTALLWALEQYTDYTDNLIDDDINKIVKGALNNDTDAVMRAGESLIDGIKNSRRG